MIGGLVASRRFLVTFTLLAAALPLASARQAATARFDVVSIKPCDPNAPFTPRGPAAPAGFRRGGAPWQASVSPGYAYWACATLAQLVDQAYADRDHPLLNIVNRQGPGANLLNQPKGVRGGPSWAETDTFTIEAKAPVEVTDLGGMGGSSGYLATLPAPMSHALRAVLEDRFKARVHRATEQQDMFALTIVKGGLNAKTMVAPTPGDCRTMAEYSAAVADGTLAQYENPRLCGRVFGGRDGTLDYSSYTLPQLARDLSTMLEHYVLDRTGIETPFNFLIKPDSGAGPLGDGLRFSRALADLGLKLEPTKGPAEYLVIDRAERPAPNPPAPIAPDGRGFGAASQPPARAQGAGR